MMQIVGVARTPNTGICSRRRRRSSMSRCARILGDNGLQIRTTRSPAAIGPALVRGSGRSTPRLAFGVDHDARAVERTLPPAISVTILVVFGGLALVLAAVGSTA